MTAVHVELEAAIESSLQPPAWEHPAPGPLFTTPGGHGQSGAPEPEGRSHPPLPRTFTSHILAKSRGGRGPAENLLGDPENDSPEPILKVSTSTSATSERGSAPLRPLWARLLREGGRRSARVRSARARRREPGAGRAHVQGRHHVVRAGNAAAVPARVGPATALACARPRPSTRAVPEVHDCLALLLRQLRGHARAHRRRRVRAGQQE